MKTLLLVLILLMTVAASQAQQVIVKDSGVVSNFGGPYKPISGDGTHTRIKNSLCKDSIVQGAGTRRLYTYDSAQLLYQLLYQSFVPANGTYADSLRNTYLYTPAGKYSTVVYETKDKNTGSLVNNIKNVYVYDGNSYLVSVTAYLWNAQDGTWIFAGETAYHNDGTGKPDTSYYNYPPGVAISTTYYSYYPSGKLYQRITYDNASGTQQLSKIETSYHDSANYVKNDSTVTRGKAYNSDTFSVITITSYTNSYNTDGTLSTSNQYLVSNYYSPGINSRYLFYYFYGPCSSVLPVSFIRFSAMRQLNNALVKWQTANEINASSFSIQRSTDGVHFITAGIVNAVGNGSHNYTFTDINALEVFSVPKLYYRLAENDKDGTIHYSSIASLDIAAGKVLITASPNPVMNVIKVYSSVTLNDAIITVSDIRGRLIYSAMQNIMAGSNIPVDVSSFAKGMYIVTVRSSSYKQQMKVVKE